MKHTSSFLLHCGLIATTVLFVLACANIGSPDGGPYDETPPRLVRTSPKQGATSATDLKKIVIEFDELVKIENAYEKVVISPPQLEQPEIEASGKKVTVTLLDSLKPNMTYTVDFADAIVDNNEGNPYGDFAFTFSTGEQVDTLQVSGHVLDASNLEPIKGMLVGLYRIEDTTPSLDSLQAVQTAGTERQSTDTLTDTLFQTTPFERISRTDGSGHFVVKGLAPGQYMIYALKDQNQNFYFDQRAEMLAFTDRVIKPWSKPAMRSDTIWHDSIHYDTIVATPYIHYYPDDIVLLAFTGEQQDRHLLKSERPILEQFSLFFTSPSDTLPKLTGLNFDADDAFVIDASEHNDTLHYWIKDSLIYNLDTLDIQLDYFATDTTGNLVLTVDTLHLASKLTKERLAKRQEEKYESWVKEYKQQQKEARRAAKRAEKEKGEEPIPATNKEFLPDTLQQTPPDVDAEALADASTKDKKKTKKRKKDEEEEIEIPPMPEELIEVKTGGVQSMDPEKNIDFLFDEPLDSVDLSKIHFSVKVDTLFQPARFLFRQVPGKIKTYRLYAEWEADSTYQIEVDTAAFVNIYGKRSAAFKRVITLKSLDAYSTLFVALQGSVPNAYVQLLNGNDKVVKTVKAQNNKADFYFLTPGTYYMRLFSDLNGNGQWDTGDYESRLQPEPLYYYPGALALKAQWEVTQTWNPTLKPLSKQKPEKITKQKPDKAKATKNRNAERQQGKKK